MVIAIAARFSKVISVVEMPGQLLVSVHWNIRLLLLCTPINYIGQTGKKEGLSPQTRTMHCGAQ